GPPGLAVELLLNHPVKPPLHEIGDGIGCPPAAVGLVIPEEDLLKLPWHKHYPEQVAIARHVREEEQLIEGHVQLREGAPELQVPLDDRFKRRHQVIAVLANDAVTLSQHRDQVVRERVPKSLRSLTQSVHRDRNAERDLDPTSVPCDQLFPHWAMIVPTT